MIYLCICGNFSAFATQHSPCRITALSASFTQLTWMKGHVDLVIYKIAYLTNDSPYCYPGHFGVLYALPHLVTTFSTRNVTTHVLQSSGRMPQTSLWPRSPNVPCSAGCLCLWSLSSWQYRLAPLQVRTALKLAGLGVPETCLNHAARLNGSPSPKNVTPFGSQ